MIDVSIETHKDLYTDVSKCVSFCRNIKNEKESDFNTDFHIYWKVGMPFERKQILIIKSYLATQNLNKTKMIFWSNVDLTSNPYLKPFLPYISFKLYNVEQEAKGTILEGRKDMFSKEDNRNSLEGDLFRSLILYKYGGIYFDIDSVLLRDFSPLLDQEFMYTWAWDINKINGAVIRLFKNSQLGNDLLGQISRTRAKKCSTCWSCNSYIEVRKKNKNWKVFPCAFFDPEWQFNPSNEQRKDKEFIDFIYFPFKKNKHSQELFDGTFSWHWHNCWDAVIEDGSKWQILEDMINNKLIENGIPDGDIIREV